MSAEKRIVVSSAHMGLGHLRAAHALHRFIQQELFIEGSEHHTQKEQKLWDEFKNAYYTMSVMGKIPVIGPLLATLLDKMEHIPPYYPRRNLAAPTPAVLYLEHCIQHRGLSHSLVEFCSGRPVHAVNTFYATASALATHGAAEKNYLVICDTDINRVWVPKNAKKSHIHFCAPCEKAYRRLIAYGVEREHITVTGFPLPVENIGSANEHEIVRSDTQTRIGRLDVNRKLYKELNNTALAYTPASQHNPITLLFAVGGAGAQVELTDFILKGLKHSLRDGVFNLNLSAGINPLIVKKFHAAIARNGLTECVGKTIRIIHHTDAMQFFDLFNQSLRSTDILITKPSELVFFAGLGIPFLCTPPVGPHETENLRWLQEHHAGTPIRHKLQYMSEWLTDMLEDGVFAGMARDAYYRLPKDGTRNITDLIHKNIM